MCERKTFATSLIKRKEVIKIKGFVQNEKEESLNNKLTLLSIKEDFATIVDDRKVY